MRLPAFLILGIFIAAPAWAQEIQAAVSNAWARATIGSTLVSAIYFEVKNTSDEPITLESVSASPGQAAMHESVNKDGMMSMRPLQAVTIPAKQSVAFAPGGKHVMLTELKEPLNEGDSVKLSLHFNNGRALNLTVPVAKAPVKGNANEHHAH